MHFHTRCSIYSERVRQAQFSSPFAFIYQCAAHLNNLNSAVYTRCVSLFSATETFIEPVVVIVLVQCVYLSSLTMCTISSIALFYNASSLTQAQCALHQYWTTISYIIIYILLFNCHNYGETIAVAFVRFSSLFVCCCFFETKWNQRKIESASVYFVWL